MTPNNTIISYKVLVSALPIIKLLIGNIGADDKEYMHRTIEWNGNLFT